MTRPRKQSVDYFPHDAYACSGDTLTVLQSQFGNDGYAFWFKLLEKLAATEGHYIDCSNSNKWQLLLAKTGVSELLGVEIMLLLVEMNAIDKDLWGSKVIWCQNLVDNLAVVYSNRHRELPKPPIISKIQLTTTGKACAICGKDIEGMKEGAKYCSDACKQKAYRVTDNHNAKIAEKPITTEVNPITTGDNPLTTDGCPQSKVKESKVKESKEDEDLGPKGTPDPFNENRIKIFEELKIRRGFNSPCAGAEAKAITWMLKQGYTVEKMLACYDKMKLDKFWQSKELHMPSVKNQIGEYVKEGKGGVSGQPSSEDKKWKEWKDYIAGGDYPK